MIFCKIGRLVADILEVSGWELAIGVKFNIFVSKINDLSKKFVAEHMSVAEINFLSIVSLYYYQP